MDFPQLHARSTYSPLAGSCRLADLASGGALCCADPNLWGAVRAGKAAKAAKVRHVPAMEVTFDDVDGHVVALARTPDGWASLRRLSSALSRPVKRGEARGCTLAASDLTGVALLTGGADGAAARAAMAGGPALGDLLRRLAAASPGATWVELAPTMGESWRVLAAAARAAGLPVAATSDAWYTRRADAASSAVLAAVRAKRRADPAHLAELDAAAAAGTGWGHLATGDELAAFFADCPEALAGAVALADSCRSSLGLGAVCLPDLVDDGGRPMGVDEQAAALRRQARAGLAARLPAGATSAEHSTRLESELAVITGMGFQGYFLAVADFVGWARRSGIAVGPGRGSAPGSVAVWALGITDADPVAHGMLFERFMNPERVSYPDIDLDFDKRRREEVVQYLRVKYGLGSVGRIMTLKPIAGKTAVKDVGRALGLGFGELNAATSGVPATVNGKPPTVAWLAANVPALREPKFADVLRHAAALEGVVRESGVHPSGVVVSRGPLADWAPTCATARGDLCVQWGWEDVEAAGLVKFDLLGLTTVTHIRLAEELINDGLADGSTEERPGIAESGGGRGSARCVDGLPGDRQPARGRPECRGDTVRTVEDTGAGVGRRLDPPARRFRVADQRLDDPAVYAALSVADTLGVFQLGKAGMRRMLRQLKPDQFGDVVAACALYRPGPIKGGMVTDYCERKHGRRPVKYLHPALRETTGSTHGCFVYQEQIMATCRLLAGYTLGGADLVRRAMHKKRPEEMAQHRREFVAGCVRLGTCDEAAATKLFDLMEFFSGYGFNVAHSTTYALLAYQTAYLKVHYPAEFYAAWLSTLCDESDRFKKIPEAVYDLRDHGIEVLPPDVNLSGRDFVPVRRAAVAPPAPAAPAECDEDDVLAVLAGMTGAGARPARQAPFAVRYGLGALRGLGKAAVEQVLAARPFADMADLLRRARVTRRDLQALVASGACDGLLAASGHSRADALASVVELAAWGATARRGAVKTLTQPTLPGMV